MGGVRHFKNMKCFALLLFAGFFLLSCQPSLEEKERIEALKQKIEEATEDSSSKPTEASPEKRGEEKSDPNWNLEEASKGLARVLCQKLAGCGERWEKFDDCVGGMHGDLLGLLTSRKDSSTPLAIETCKEAIKGGDCTLIRNYQFPNGCEIIR